MLAAAQRLQLSCGMVVAVPIPAQHAAEGRTVSPVRTVQHAWCSAPSLAHVPFSGARVRAPHAAQVEAAISTALQEVEQKRIAGNEVRA